ncbi:hypothetical protein C1H46_012681 [Malus baccata]|uniref:Uncharacterized protein n=1 Tax=Malus baccata TaxID=106549 RepID=A0A540MSG3_MALBA|nr:hypothetical protein C1H46_012681 [Malus baccata]
MDDNSSGDSSGGFSQKDSSAASSVSASVMNNAAASRVPEVRLRQRNAPKKKRASAIMAREVYVSSVPGVGNSFERLRSVYVFVK